MIPALPAEANLPPAATTLAAAIAALPWVRRIILFGSRARGDHGPRSDIDLAVEAPGAGPREWDAIAALAEACETFLSMDLVRFDRASGSFRERILAEGVVLHERTADQEELWQS